MQVIVKREEYENTFLRFAYALGFNSTPFFYPYNSKSLQYIKFDDILGYNWRFPDWVECQDNVTGEKVLGTPVWRLGFYSRKNEKLKFECIQKLKENPIQFFNWFMPGYNTNYYDYNTWREKNQFNVEKRKRNELIKVGAIRNGNVLKTGDVSDNLSIWDVNVLYKRIKQYYRTIKSHNDFLFKREASADLSKFVRTTVNTHAPIVRLICRNDFDRKFPKKLLTLINRTLHTHYDNSLFLYTEHTLTGDSVVYLYTDKVYEYESKVLFSKAIASKLQMELDTVFKRQYFTVLPLSINVMGSRDKSEYMEIMEHVIAKASRISKDEKQALYDGNLFQLDKFMEELPKNGMQLKIPEVVNANKGRFVETMKDIPGVASFCRSRGWVVRAGNRSKNQVKIVTAGILRGFSEGQCRELLDTLWEGSSDYPAGLPARMFSQLYSYCAVRNSRKVVQHTTTYEDIFYDEKDYGDMFLRDFRHTNKYKSHFIPDVIRILNEKQKSLGKHHVINCMLRKNPKQVHKLFKEINNQLIENVFYNIHNERKNDFKAEDYGDLNRKIYFSFTIFKKVCLHIDFMKDYKDPTLKQFYYVVKDVLMKYYNLFPIKLTDKHTYIATKICEQYTSEFMNNDVFTVKYMEVCNKLGSKDAKRIMRRFKDWLLSNNIEVTYKENLDILFDAFVAECKKPDSPYCIQEVLDVLKAHKMGGVRNKKRYYEVAKRRMQLNRLINNT